jgi:hypothetical protein
VGNDQKRPPPVQSALLHEISPGLNPTARKKIPGHVGREQGGTPREGEEKGVGRNSNKVYRLTTFTGQRRLPASPRR